jgi:tetratricopeptide (TPR) repeat protein
LLAALATAGCATTSRDDRSPAERMLVAEVALDRGQYPLAAREYRLAAATGGPPVAERAARVAFEYGQDVELERGAREWLQREPDNEVARRFLAVALLNQDRVDEAGREFAALLESAYASPAEGFVALRQSLDEVRNPSGAARMLGRLAAAQPEVAEAHFAHGALALQAGDSPTAVAAAGRALALRSDWREARWLEVRARIAGGDCVRGLAASAALSAESSDADRLLHAWMLAACERDAEARPIFEDLARGRLMRPEALEALAGLDLEAGRYDDAVNRYTELLATGRHSDRAFFGLALVADRRGTPDRAIGFYSRVTTGPRADAAQLRAYRLLLQQGDAAAAARQLDDYVAATTDGRVIATAGRAQVLVDHGRGADGLALLDRSIAAFPDQEELRYARAFVLERMDRIDEAIAELRGVAKRRPEDASALNALGYTLADHGRSLAEAERLIRAALAQRPDSAAIQDSLGWVLHRRGRSAEALEWLQRAYASEPDPEIAAHLGEVQWTLGDRAGAERTWRTALEQTPGNRHLQEALDRHLGPRT